ncbi:hypothetical protein GP486_008045 [Trichoglossum hirsutum]|uniref:AMMECR1 domain-containing protein n=1 Tax=Trichoglossum hirsutum TaxID=265104 RepID=A0A9P8IAM0_9PEZI|nr:hypothetical protein GP486_008045 [Trichoglossum hirsutum]
MATPAHCLYCFESLAASLEHKELLSLRQVHELWEKYKAAQADAVDADADVPDVDVEGPSDIEGEIEEELSSLRENFKSNGTLEVPGSSSGSSSSTPSSVSTSSSSRTPTSGLGSSSSNSSSNSLLPATGRRLGSQPQGVYTNHQQDEDKPLFVTWNTVSRSGNKTLRGCIGTFEAQELEHGLKNYALTSGCSAFDDSRFLPIAKRELPTLECGVTLLTDFEPAPTPMSWDIGTHGLRISFTYHSKRYGATYLPDVPVEQGWTKEETLVSLMRKAGWSGKRDEWRKVADLKVVRYQGKKVAVDYAGWMEWKEWVEKHRDL